MNQTNIIYLLSRKKANASDLEKERSILMKQLEEERKKTEKLRLQWLKKEVRTLKDQIESEKKMQENYEMGLNNNNKKRKINPRKKRKYIDLD